MTLLIQHGYGKSDKIERALAAGHVSGVILSPRDEAPRNLADYVAELADSAAPIIVDPQFYATTVVDVRAGKLLDYDYFETELGHRNFIRAADISRYIGGALNHQCDLAVTHLCLPTVAFDSFGDRWHTVALSMAAEAMSDCARRNEERPVLTSFVLHESALRAAPELDDFLDVITEFDCAGFYIIIRRDGTAFSQGIEPDILSGLLYLTYVLSELNDFTVIFGYSDFLSLPLHAAGATATACGWQLGLRRFTFARFEPAAGGRAPRPRYSSLPLLNSIVVTPDLDQIQAVGELRRVLSHTAYDGVLNVARPSAAHWPMDVSALHHWATLADGIERLNRQRGVAQRLDEMARLMQGARNLYARLRERGVNFEPSSGPIHLEQWARGLDDFRTRHNV